MGLVLYDPLFFICDGDIWAGGYFKSPNNFSLREKYVGAQIEDPTYPNTLTIHSTGLVISRVLESIVPR